jgi:predicted transcriptional regulator
VPPKGKAATIELPQAIADEIADAAHKTHRSTAFIVARALAAGRGAPAVALTAPLTALPLTSDEDDPASALASAKKASAAEVAAAWTATRARFAAWIAREVEAQKAEHADDLDAGLRDAADGKSPPARLVELARCEYVRVRTLLIANPALPSEALAILRDDKDRVVKEALENRKLAGK